MIFVSPSISTQTSKTSIDFEDFVVTFLLHQIDLPSFHSSKTRGTQKTPNFRGPSQEMPALLMDYSPPWSLKFHDTTFSSFLFSRNTIPQNHWGSCGGGSCDNGDWGRICVPMPELALCPFIRDTWRWMHHCYPSLRPCSLFGFTALNWSYEESRLFQAPMADVW